MYWFFPKDEEDNLYNMIIYLFEEKMLGRQKIFRGARKSDYRLSNVFSRDEVNRVLLSGPVCMLTNDHDLSHLLPVWQQSVTSWLSLLFITPR